MKIGFFDTGSGGYYTMLQCRKQLPNYDYCFFGDRKHLPFGTKTAEEIQRYTFEGIERLFDQGCSLVILACNTAAAYSIRKWQSLYPEKKVLSVTIPLVESLIATGAQNISLCATPATVNSGILQDLFQTRGYMHNLNLISCPGLADAIESSIVWNEDGSYVITMSLEEQIRFLSQYKIPTTDCVGLACTHYGLRMKAFEKIFPDIPIVDTADVVPASLSDYITHHPEIIVSKNGTMQTYRSE